MLLRCAAAADLEEILAVYRAAKRFMDETGNPDQWAPGYPGQALVEADIAEGRGRVLEDGGEILAVLAFFTEPDPTYGEIREGAWPDGLPYATVHRIAARRQGQGLAGIALQQAAAEAASLGFSRLRMDTYRDNRPMQHFLARAGFLYCGIISLTGDFTDSHRLRLAYQLALPEEKLRLTGVMPANWEAICLLHPGREGARFVSSNAYSLAQAAFEDGWITRGIYRGETPIGFAMYGSDRERGTAELCRFMLGEAYQGKGYGKIALRMLLDEMEAAFSGIPLELSTDPDNARGRHVYEAAGFVSTGEFCGEGDDREEIFRLIRRV